jgi:hypothetical protein
LFEEEIIRPCGHIFPGTLNVLFEVSKRRSEMSADLNKDNSSQTSARFGVTFLVGTVFFFAIWCVVSIHLPWLPGCALAAAWTRPVSQGVWWSNGKGTHLIGKSSEYIIELHVDNSLPAVVEDLDLENRKPISRSGL